MTCINLKKSTPFSSRFALFGLSALIVGAVFSVGCLAAFSSSIPQRCARSAVCLFAVFGIVGEKAFSLGLNSINCFQQNYMTIVKILQFAGVRGLGSRVCEQARKNLEYYRAKDSPRATKQALRASIVQRQYKHQTQGRTGAQNANRQAAPERDRYGANNRRKTGANRNKEIGQEQVNNRCKTGIKPRNNRSKTERKQRGRLGRTFPVFLPAVRVNKTKQEQHKKSPSLKKQGANIHTGSIKSIFANKERKHLACFNSRAPH